MPVLPNEGNEKKGVVVLFSDPRFCRWVIPNDHANTYHIAASRNPPHTPLRVMTYQNWNEVETQGSSADPYVNATAIIPVDKRSSSFAARLLWLDCLPLSELWFFAYCRPELALDAASKAGAQVRVVNLFPYLQYKNLPLQAIRFRDAHSVSVFLQELRPASEILTCTWLAFEGLPEATFENFQLQEGSDQFLFRFMARGANLRSVFFEAADLESCWRCTIKQDAMTHESADPLYCLPAERDEDFVDYITHLCEDFECLFYRSKLSEPLYVDFVRGGFISTLNVKRPIL